MKCTSPRSWGIFPFFAGPAKNVYVFAIVTLNENIVTLYPQIFFLRVVKPSQNLWHKITAPDHNVIPALLFVFLLLVSHGCSPYLSHTHSHTRLLIMTHLVEYIVHQLKCRPQRICIFLNQLESIIDCNGLQKMGFPRYEHF